jgi:CRP/FNR family cyclic AMP-dependent transcriptional regulator
MHESEVLSNVSPLGARAVLHPAGGICLLQADAGLRRAIPAADQRLAERVLTAPRCTLTPGMDVAGQLATGGQEPFGALLVDGFVARESTVAGDVSAELLGPGDIVRPWRVSESAVPCTTRWAVPAGAVAAVLDGRFLMAARRWPELAAVVRERLADQLDAAATRAAIIGLRRVDQRLLAMFWLLADRWGRVHPEGVVVDLPVTHQFLGRLVAARRSTVTLAMKELADEGLLNRSGRGRWTLAHGSLGALSGHTASGGAAPAGAEVTPLRPRVVPGRDGLAVAAELAAPPAPM